MVATRPRTDRIGPLILSFGVCSGCAKRRSYETRKRCPGPTHGRDAAHPRGAVRLGGARRLGKAPGFLDGQLSRQAQEALRKKAPREMLGGP